MIEDQYLLAYFGRQSDLYLEQYREFHAGKRFTFNAGAFLGGLFWFLYRKLFIETVFVLVAVTLLSLLDGFFYVILEVSYDTEKILNFFWIFVYATIYGFIGNRIYIRKADKKIKEILSSTDDEVIRMDLLRKKGGVSWVPFLVLLLGILTLIILSSTQ